LAQIQAWHDHSALAWCYHQPSARHSFNQKRHLTRREQSMVRGIFGNAVNMNIVRVIGVNCDAFPVAVTMGSDIYFFKDSDSPGGTYYRKDFSRASLYLKGSMMHEITHVFQHQSAPATYCERPSRSHYSNMFRYRLTRSSRFGNFCNEKQAAIIEDYFRWFRTPQHQPLWIAKTRKNAALLKHVVQARFPHARG
jgi:hypothetical protein